MSMPASSRPSQFLHPPAYPPPELRSCVKVEVAAVGCPSLIVLNMVSVDGKQYLKMKEPGLHALQDKENKLLDKERAYTLIPPLLLCDGTTEHSHTRGIYPTYTPTPEILQRCRRRVG